MDELKYFRDNIYVSKSAYNGWKMLRYSRSKDTVGEELVNRYIEIYTCYPEFFVITERSFLITWVTQVLHPFDGHPLAMSFRKLSENKLEDFLSKNNHQEIYRKLKDVRDKLFAHRDKDIDGLDLSIPPIDQMDLFFDELEKLYSDITREIDNSSTTFMNTDNIKHQVESLFMNLERGEAQRRKEIDINYMWRENKNKASDIL